MAFARLAALRLGGRLRPPMARLRTRKTNHLVAGALARGFAVIVLANLLFLALMLIGQINHDLIIARVRAAFKSGDLGDVDFLWFATHRGWFQYNDCNVLQMLANQDAPRLQLALAPKVFFANEDWKDQCAVLRALTVRDVDPSAFQLLRYTRYWHGYNVIAALALRRMELRDLRRMLSDAVWIAIAVLAFAACRSGPHAQRTGLAIALTAATVWGAPYFAPGLTQGPGDTLLLLALAAIAAWPRMTVSLVIIVPYAAAFGAAVVFLEMLTGQLPIAAAWLIALTLAAARDQEQHVGLAPPPAALSALMAFGVAAAATVILKQILAITLGVPRAGEDFLAQLALYMRVPESEEGRHAGILLPFIELVRWSKMLTFGRSFAGYGLVVMTALTWGVAAIRGWRAREHPHGRDILILVSAALIPIGWVLLLPNHTYIHAPFMVRMLVVPISLAPLALCWPTARSAL
jgi:hypothetical protein